MTEEKEGPEKSGPAELERLQLENRILWDHNQRLVENMGKKALSERRNVMTLIADMLEVKSGALLLARSPERVEILREGIKTLTDLRTLILASQDSARS
jgi:hypothetical protein